MKAVLALRPIPFVQALTQFRVANASALAQQLRQVVQSGGEGLMLHHGDALWQAGRSESLHKLKVAEDEDARVVGHVPGKGRLSGRLGALLVELPQGQRFALGSGLTDTHREKPPEVGAWVTYRYRGRTPSGLPRFASFLRERLPEKIRLSCSQAQAQVRLRRTHRQCLACAWTLHPVGAGCRPKSSPTESAS